MAMSLHSPYEGNEGGGATAAYSRDVSFSSYLDTAERDFVRNLSTSIYSPSPGRHVPTPRTSMGTRVPRHELGVFGAESYFNEKLYVNTNDQTPPIPRKQGNVRHKQNNRSPKGDYFSEKKSTTSSVTTKSTTSFKSPSPSLRSEGSNWNTQIGVGLKLFSGLQCKGTCFNTQEIVQPSTKVHKDHDHKNRYRKSRVSHQDHFAFPIIDTASYNNNHHLDEKPRKSLEVFGFHHTEKKQDIAQHIERKLSILAWDAIPNSHSNASIPFLYTTTKRNSSNGADQDARSEASSDLFEIENLSGVPASQQSSYAPSEASIEWSVVTASAAEFSAVSNHHGDEKTMITMEKTMKIHQKSSSSSGGLLLGCTSHKSVDVVGSFTNKQLRATKPL